jgi:RNA-directed DNA polymerase
MSSHNIKKPNGGVTMRRAMDKPDPNGNLLEQMFSPDNVLKAWKQVKANNGVSGVDNMSIEEFPEFAHDQWKSIKDSLIAGTYQPFPVKRVEISKPSGGKRPLGIPTVLDRVIQQAMYQVMMPIFDLYFSEFSYGFRPGRSAHDAVYQLREYIRQGYRIAVDMDLSKFFDRVNHDLLMHRVAKKVRDKQVLRLIGKYLRAGVMISNRLQETHEGVPQGGPLSPLLANILLDDLDKELEKRGHKFVRYADDFVILVKTQRAGLRVKESISCFLEKKLKLKVNQDKSRVASTDDIDFLGFTFKGTKIRWTDKAFREFKRRVKQLTGRSWFVSMEYRYEKLAQYIRGWVNYFGIAEYYRPIPEVDSWLRRRIRMCYWKQWRYVKTKVRNLLKLGTKRNVAIPMCLSRKGPWNCARTLATQTGMTNQWLKDQGLVSVKELWVNIHYPATAR